MPYSKYFSSCFAMYHEILTQQNMIMSTGVKTVYKIKLKLKQLVLVDFGFDMLAKWRC